MIYTPKTKVNDADVRLFLDSIEDTQKRDDSYTLLDIFDEVSGEEAKMWGSSIIGYGIYSYEGKSCKGEWMRTGFAPRKVGISIYIMPGYGIDMEPLLKQLGKHKIGRSCLNIKKISDINIDILKKIIKKGLDIMEEKYPL